MGSIAINNWCSCDRCGGVYATDRRFAYVEVRGEREWDGLEICPNCTDKLLWFLNHPEDDEEGEE